MREQRPRGRRATSSARNTHHAPRACYAWRTKGPAAGRAARHGGQSAFDCYGWRATWRLAGCSSVDVEPPAVAWYGRRNTASSCGPAAGVSQFAGGRGCAIASRVSSASARARAMRSMRTSRPTQCHSVSIMSRRVASASSWESSNTGEYDFVASPTFQKACTRQRHGPCIRRAYEPGAQHAIQPA